MTIDKRRAIDRDLLRAGLIARQRLADAVGPAASTRNPLPSGKADRLLRSAVELFAERGFHGTTTRLICQRAGTGEAAVYDHFASKEEILYLVSRIAHEEVLSRLFETLSTDTEDAEQELRALVRSLTSFHAEWMTAARIANYELAALTPKHRAEVIKLRDQIQELVESAVLRGIGEDRFRVRDVKTTVFAILSMCIGVSRWFKVGGRLSPRSLGDIYADLAIGMLREDPT